MQWHLCWKGQKRRKKLSSNFSCHAQIILTVNSTVIMCVPAFSLNRLNHICPDASCSPLSPIQCFPLLLYIFLILLSDKWTSITVVSHKYYLLTRQTRMKQINKNGQPTVVWMESQNWEETLATMPDAFQYKTNQELCLMLNGYQILLNGFALTTTEYSWCYTQHTVLYP